MILKLHHRTSNDKSENSKWKIVPRNLHGTHSTCRWEQGVFLLLGAIRTSQNCLPSQPTTSSSAAAPTGELWTTTKTQREICSFSPGGLPVVWRWPSRRSRFSGDSVLGVATGTGYTGLSRCLRRAQLPVLRGKKVSVIQNSRWLGF